MNSAQQKDLLDLLKALADKHRLTMISLMGQGQERTVTEMAEGEVAQLERAGNADATITNYFDVIDLPGNRTLFAELLNPGFVAGVFAEPAAGAMLLLSAVSFTVPQSNTPRERSAGGVRDLIDPIRELLLLPSAVAVLVFVLTFKLGDTSLIPMTK